MHDFIVFSGKHEYDVNNRIQANRRRPCACTDMRSAGTARR